jgi:hypothetical protein
LPIKRCKTVAILGTASIGKRSLFLVVLKSLIEDPTKFGLKTSSFYFQTIVGGFWLYDHVQGNDFNVRLLVQLDGTIPLFADMETDQTAPKEHAGVSIFFSPLRSSCYKEVTKSCWLKVMPTWSGEEQADLFNSPQFESEYGKQVAERAYDNMFYSGGSIATISKWR